MHESTSLFFFSSSLHARATCFLLFRLSSLRSFSPSFSVSQRLSDLDRLLMHFFSRIFLLSRREHVFHSRAWIWTFLRLVRSTLKRKLKFGVERNFSLRLFFSDYVLSRWGGWRLVYVCQYFAYHQTRWSETRLRVDALICHILSADRINKIVEVHVAKRLLKFNKTATFENCFRNVLRLNCTPFSQNAV